ncbi:hypothetical protein SPHINGOT1_260028 [Sphingomonas sp. T1]|nr:hypothetical protein SPHINGOT1_260028 [Sphingomonas sp. T1]
MMTQNGAAHATSGQVAQCSLMLGFQEGRRKVRPCRPSALSPLQTRQGGDLLDCLPVDTEHCASAARLNHPKSVSFRN